MPDLHFLDYLVLAGYFAVLLALGKIGSHQAKSGEGFFLAGRKLGKLYQFFLNFGNSVAAGDAVSTSTLVYQQGVSGIWVGFQMIFLNPYYWFMFPWYRRVRLTTTADIFQDRLGSRRLALFYAAFQIVMGIAVVMGFSNLVAYKITAALITKPEATWTAEQRRSVTDYRQLSTLENSQRAGTTLSAAENATLQTLRDRLARGELHNYVTAIQPWTFYIGFTVLVGIYMVLGGMAAAALNEAFQGVLILVFSVILIPTGLAAIGGWDRLGASLTAAQLNLFGASGVSDFTGWTIAAVFFATVLQAHAMPHNMSIGSSARNEYAARFGAVAGTFGKRIVTITWALSGLIAIVMFSGANTLADPDLVWGTMSRQLLGPGLLGLMLAGVLAASMSAVAAKAMAVSALFARNIYGTFFRRDAADEDLVRVGRITLIVALVLGVIVATRLSNIYVVLQFAMTINVPFGAAILLMFTWRRLTSAAVWTAVIGSAGINIVFPLVAQHVPALRNHPALVARTGETAGRPLPVYFESVIRSDATDANSPLQGRGRLHTELVILRGFGMDIVNASPGGRLAGRFFVDAMLPLVLLLAVSLATRPPEAERVRQFFGKMKTPVAATPEEDQRAMEETRQRPERFDDRKLFQGTAWEFTRWDKVDAIGFAVSCAVTVAIIGAFLGLLGLIRS